MGLSIGIDLGTTNSVGAYSRDGGNPCVIPTTPERERLTPSVVARHREGRLLVGTTAIRTAEGENVIFSIKRLMGRRYGDREVKEVMSHVPYRIVPDDGTGMAHVVIGERSYSPIEVSAMILEKIKADAEAALGQRVTHAVITVPAYFDDNQKVATRQAGGLAGLQVKRIIDEPTAAAYAFGMDSLDSTVSETVLVYDLGGGTFDVSIIFVSRGIPTVEIIQGDNWLGGDNFDAMIMDFVIAEQEEKRRGIGQELRNDRQFMWRLKQEAEQAKRILGQAPSADIVIYGSLSGKINVECNVRKTDFERWIRPAIERSIAKVEEAMEAPGLSPEDIDHVLLVGGSTGLPLVRELLAHKFGKDKLKAIVDPMECVALGAAILASRTVKKFCLKNHENEPDAERCSASDCPSPDISIVGPKVKCNHCGKLNEKQASVCSNCDRPLIGGGPHIGMTAKHYGIGIEGDRFEIVIPKGTRYPIQEPIFREFKTVADRQERIVIPVYQGFDEIASKNELQAEIVIPADGPIPEDKRVPKDTPLDIGFTVDDSSLTIQVRGKGALAWLDHGEALYPWESRPRPPKNGDEPTVGITVSCPRCKQSNRRSASVCENCGERLTAGPELLPEWKQELAFAVRLAEIATRDYDWVIEARKIQSLESLVDRARRALDTNDEAAGRLVKPELERALNDTCGGIMDLVHASLFYRHGLGELDQRQRLGSLLEEYKRRVLGGGDPRSAEIKDLRDVKIRDLVQEIMEWVNGRGTISCPHDSHHKTRPYPLVQVCDVCGRSLVHVNREM